MTFRTWFVAVYNFFVVVTFPFPLLLVDRERPAVIDRYLMKHEEFVCPRPIVVKPIPASTIPEFLGRVKLLVSVVVNSMKRSSADTDFSYSCRNKASVTLSAV